LVDLGKHKGSDSDSYDEDDGIEGSFQIASEHDDVEKGVIAASKMFTQVSIIGC